MSVASSNRTRFRPQEEPSLARLAAVRAQALTDASISAFGASTLEEAQAILGAANPALTDSITFDVPFLDVTSAAPAQSALATATVPVGNPGIILATTLHAATVSINAGAFNAVSSTGGLITIADGDTVQFQRGLAGTTTITLRDNTTGEALNDDFTLEAT